MKTTCLCVASRKWQNVKERKRESSLSSLLLFQEWKYQIQMFHTSTTIQTKCYGFQESTDSDTMAFVKHPVFHVNTAVAHVRYTVFNWSAIIYPRKCLFSFRFIFSHSVRHRTCNECFPSFLRLHPTIKTFGKSQRGENITIFTFVNTSPKLKHWRIVKFTTEIGEMRCSGGSSSVLTTFHSWITSSYLTKWKMNFFSIVIHLQFYLDK